MQMVSAFPPRFSPDWSNQRANAAPKQCDAKGVNAMDPFSSLSDFIRWAIFAMVPPLALWATYVPRRSDPDFSSDNEVRIVCKLGGVLLLSISVGLSAGSKSVGSSDFVLVSGDDDASARRTVGRRM